MKKYFLIFVFPVLSVLCSLFIWLIGSGGVILLLWFFRDICIPVLHFCAIGYLIKSRSFKKTSIILGISLLFAAIALNIILMGLAAPNSRSAFFFALFDMIWATICGIVIIGNAAIVGAKQHKLPVKAFVLFEAVIALLVNALMTWYLSPILAASFALDDVEILLLPSSVIILSVFSYLLGYTISHRNAGVKLFTWLLGVLTSVFVSLWLLGTPHILPIYNRTESIIWLTASIIVFGCSLLGFAHRQSSTDI